MEKLNQLSLGEKLIAGGGVGMLIASLLDWYSFSELGFSFGQDGWGKPGDLWSILAILTSIGLAGTVLAHRLGNMQLPPMGTLTWGQIYGGGGAAVAALVLLKGWRILAVPAGGFGIGFFLAVVCAGALAYGGYLLYTEEKTGAGFRR